MMNGWKAASRCCRRRIFFSLTTLQGQPWASMACSLVSTGLISFLPRPHEQASLPASHQNVRHFSRGGYSKLRHKKKKQDPLKILGFAIKKDETVAYSAVKAQFLKIAMKHHPDTSNAKTTEDLEEHKRIFMEARDAFELLAEAPDGTARLRQDSDQWQEDDFNSWFQEQTGHDMPYMDAQTMKEVAEMTETVGGGLDRDGGMWTLARMVTQSVKQGDDGRDVLRLEAGEVRSREINGILRRKRKR